MTSTELHRIPTCWRGARGDIADRPAETTLRRPYVLAPTFTPSPSDATMRWFPRTPSPHAVQASATNALTVTIPSEYMPQQTSIAFVLRVDTELGGSSEVEVVVYKSSVELPVLKVRRAAHMFFSYVAFTHSAGNGPRKKKETHHV